MQTKTIILLCLVFISFPKSSFSNPLNDWLRIGENHMRKWDFNQAVFYFTKAIEENPTSAHAYLLRSKAYLNLDEYQKSKDDYLAALNLDPEFFENYIRYQKTKANINPGISDPQPSKPPLNKYSP